MSSTKDFVQNSKWFYRVGLTDKSFPVESGRYSVVSVDRSQNLCVDCHGAVDDFSQAKKVGEEILSSADRVEVWDSIRGYMVAFMEA